MAKVMVQPGIDLNMISLTSVNLGVSNSYTFSEVLAPVTGCRQFLLLSARAVSTPFKKMKHIGSTSC
jgi:uncharacterized membrane protein YhhN